MIPNKYYYLLENINTFVDSNAVVEEGAVILFNSVILGNSIIKSNAVIGPNSVIIDSNIGENTVVLNSYVTDSIIEKNTKVGPFANIKSNSKIGNNVRIGNFVEIKASTVCDFVKAAHLAYIGDAVIGERTNFGCGAITVNYDGKEKHKTIIGTDVFIGSNSNLVAPITIRDNSFIACGSTITLDVPDFTLSIARSRQVNKIDYFKNKQ
jgi:bifunctional UDP-N-acetylglucosamine pyrophosphorylase/glucosamine-1-phosphate N-acetyltransferase